MILKKKTIIIVTLVMLIVAAGYISMRYGSASSIAKNGGVQQSGQGASSAGSTDTSVTQASSGYFVDTKIGKNNERTALKQTLSELIDSTNADKDAKKDAEEQYNEMVARAENEMVMEDLIKAKDFDDAVVLLSEDQANVVLKSKEVTADQVNVVKNIVCRVSKLPASKITVQCKE